MHRSLAGQFDGPLEASLYALPVRAVPVELAAPLAPEELRAEIPDFRRDLVLDLGKGYGSQLAVAVHAAGAFRQQLQRPYDVGKLLGGGKPHRDEHEADQPLSHRVALCYSRVAGQQAPALFQGPADQLTIPDVHVERGAIGRPAASGPVRPASRHI